MQYQNPCYGPFLFTFFYYFNFFSPSVTKKRQNPQTSKGVRYVVDGGCGRAVKNKINRCPLSRHPLHNVYAILYSYSYLSIHLYNLYIYYQHIYTSYTIFYIIYYYHHDDDVSVIYITLIRKKSILNDCSHATRISLFYNIRSAKGTKVNKLLFIITIL